MPDYTKLQHVFCRTNYFRRLGGLDSPRNATNNTYFLLLPSNVSSGLFRTCLPLWRKPNVSISKSKRYLPGYKDFQGRNIYHLSWETAPFRLYFLFWRWKQELRSIRRYLYTNLHGVMAQKTVTFKMMVVIISNAYPLSSLYRVSIHTVQYSNYEWVCLTQAYCFDLTCSVVQSMLLQL
jgi:hypothetical protein